MGIRCIFISWLQLFLDLYCRYDVHIKIFVNLRSSAFFQRLGPHIGAILAVGLHALLLKMQPDTQNKYNNLGASKVEYCSRKSSKYRDQNFELYNENEVSEMNVNASPEV